jgi:hypothetical protein
MNYYNEKLNYKERDEEIYYKREVEKRTLKSIGDEYGLSSERIRGITARLYRKKLIEKEMGSRWLNPKVMGDIQWSSVRIVNCLVNEGAIEMSIEEFIEIFNFHRLMRVPNFGRKAMQELCRKLEQHGYKDIDHFRSAKLANHRGYKREYKKTSVYKGEERLKAWGLTL